MVKIDLDNGLGLVFPMLTRLIKAKLEECAILQVSIEEALKRGAWNLD
jgi:hypothetical protein|uniref:Uncharacterized protein n=1 Tax=Populus trichocarpa TaxID=3694 RepID=A9PEM2_POPTR|nr:unknown [Populus trichocarpa]